ncbi:MAG: sensory/regulatory protein RpfC [Pseudomonadota bacterium]
MPMSSKSVRPTGKHWLVARLTHRPDSEHELTLSRLALSMVAFLALFIGYLSGSEEHRLFLEKIGIYFIAFTGATLFLFVHLLVYPGVSRFRRLLGIPIDIGCVAYLMHSGDELTAFTYPIFLWAIFGNGFRFGVKYLFIAAFAGFLAFLAVIVTTPFWRDNRELSAGLLAGLIILPIYVSMLIRRLSEAKRQAEEASRAKSLFLASLSHELRTPLNAVIGLSDMLAGAQLPREQADMARTIGKSGRSLLNLINSLLDLSRMEIGKKPQMGVFDLQEMLHDIRDMLNVQARAKGIGLVLHLDPDLPQHVQGSMRHFEEVLINLVGNAVKFTSHGSVRIGAHVVDETDETMRLRLDVTDTGIGIAPEAQARIFESFTQADETIIDRFGGTGLGLAIARQLVEAHGGEIGVQSILGQGSTFWFEMQVGKASVAEIVAQAPVAVARCLRPLRILVAEDNRTNQMVIAQILKQDGHEAVMVENGDLAVEALLQESFDLVLMDLNMPVMNGLDAAKFYAFAMVGQDRVPVIALTADATEQTAEKCRAAGMAACLNKPIEPQALLAAVAQHARQSVPLAAPSTQIAPEDATASMEPVDPRALSDLEKLGGKSFVSEIVAQFISDAALVLQKLGEAVQMQDVTGFRDHAHALRSCAANVGAQAVYRRCLDLRDIDESELARAGLTHVRALERDFASACGILRPLMQAA